MSCFLLNAKFQIIMLCSLPFLLQTVVAAFFVVVTTGLGCHLHVLFTKQAPRQAPPASAYGSLSSCEHCALKNYGKIMVKAISICILA